MSSFHEEFVIFCILEDSVTMVPWWNVLWISRLYGNWSFQYDRVAKFECFSRFQGQDRSIYMLCQFKLNKPRRWMHGIRWFIFSTRLPFSARPGTLWVLIWTPNTSFVSLREPTKPFCFPWYGEYWSSQYDASQKC